MNRTKYAVILFLTTIGLCLWAYLRKDWNEVGFIKAFIANPEKSDEYAKRFGFEIDSLFLKVVSGPEDVEFFKKYFEKFGLRPFKSKCIWGEDPTNKRLLGTCNVENRNGYPFIDFNFVWPYGASKRVFSIVLPHYVNGVSAQE